MTENWLLRVIQRFRAEAKTLRRLVALERQCTLSSQEQLGLFESIHEPAWNVLKDELDERGFVVVIASENTTRERANDQIHSGRRL